MSLVPTREDLAFDKGYRQATKAGGLVIDHLTRRLHKVEVERDEARKQLENANAAVSALNGDLHQMGQKLEKFRDALALTEKAEDIHANCDECGGEGEAEECEFCFPSADDARIARRLALTDDLGAEK